MSQNEFKNNHECKEGECCCFKSRAILGEPRTPGMVTWLVKKGIVKSELVAGRVLLTITIVSFVLAILISSSFLFGFSIGSEKTARKTLKPSISSTEVVTPKKQDISR